MQWVKRKKWNCLCGERNEEMLVFLIKIEINVKLLHSLNQIYFIHGMEAILISELNKEIKWAPNGMIDENYEWNA